jgi:thiosulfate/3-mercaptopyruvate sulfurtransferase
MRMLASRPFIRPPALHHLLPKTATRKYSSEGTPYQLSSYIVSPHDLDIALRKNIHSKLSTAPRIIPLCASWYMPNDAKKRTGLQSFLSDRIPHARFFDLDAVKDDKSPYPHMLPSPEVFAKAMGELGIRKDDSVVVYDSADLGIFSAPRVAWTLKVFGHDGVHILNNYKLWIDQGFAVEKGEPQKIEAVSYPVPELAKEKVMSFEELKETVKEQGKDGAEEVQVLDARSKGRFDGSDPEPRAGNISRPLSFPLHLSLTIDRSLLRPRALLNKHPFLRRHFRPHKSLPPRLRTKTLFRNKKC